MAIRGGRTSITSWRAVRSTPAASSRSTATRTPSSEWAFAETAVAHARLAGIPSERVINCWPLDFLLEWASGRAG